MKLKYPVIIMGATMTLTLGSCTNDDSDFDSLLSQSKEQPADIEFNDNVLIELPDRVPASTDESYFDYIESFTPKVSVDICFADGEATVNASSTSGMFISNVNGHVAVNIGTKAVRFTLSGHSADGSLKIMGEKRFAIVLDNLDLTNPYGPAINNQCKKTLYIDAPEGTVNRLASLGGDREESDSKGCLFSEGQIAFSGSGEIEVNSAFRNAVSSDDFIVTRPGCRLKLASTAGHGIKANDGVKINGGTIDILVDYNGGKGINCESSVTIAGGRTTIINRATSRLDPVDISDEFPQGIDTVNCAGIKTDDRLTVNAGQLLIKCTGDNSKGIKCVTDYVQDGGSVSVVTLGGKVLSSPKAIKTDGSIDISGGSLYAYSLHSVALDADGGINVYAYRRQKSYLVEIGQ